MRAPTRRDGSGAPLAVLALVVVAAAAIAGGRARAEDKFCQLQSLGELPAKVERGQIVTEGQIDGKPVRLIVDTGAFGTLIFEAEARRLGLVLRRIDAQGVGIGGASQIYTARVETFTVGGLTEHNQDLVVTGAALGATGVIGAKFLLQTDVEFDIAHGAVRFFRPHGCTGDQVVYWGQPYAVTPLVATPGDRIVVTVQINGKPILAQMDSGASASVLTRDAAALAGVNPNSNRVIEEDETHGLGATPLRTWAGRFETFRFGDETIKGAELRIADLFRAGRVRRVGDLIATPVQDEPQMLLGADFFRSHRLFFALDQRKVYASYEGGPVFYAVRREPTGARPASGP